MQDYPEVSVIMPAFNSEATIDAAIVSVREQSFSDWELIIIDDRSSDRTREKIASWEFVDERIHAVFLNCNGGAAAARNAGLDMAAGRYMAFLDSDDRWKPEKLENQLAFMKSHHYAFTFTGYEYILADGTANGKKVTAPKQVSYTDMLKNTIVGCLTVMIDRSLTGPFRMPPLRARQDLATWLSLLKKGICAYGLDQCLAEYRISGKGSVSGNKWKSAGKTWYVYRNVEKLSMLSACWYFCNYAANAVLKRL